MTKIFKNWELTSMARVLTKELTFGLGILSCVLPGIQRRIFVLFCTWHFVLLFGDCCWGSQSILFVSGFFRSHNHATFLLYYIPKGYKVRYKVTSSLGTNYPMFANCSGFGDVREVRSSILKFGKHFWTFWALFWCGKKGKRRKVWKSSDWRPPS